MIVRHLMTAVLNTAREIESSPQDKCFLFNVFEFISSKKSMKHSERIDTTSIVKDALVA